MTRQEYRSLLGRLPIKCPTPQDMAMMCPHLTAEEAVAAFTTGSGYVACPPLRVRHGFQIISYRKEWVEEIEVIDKVGGVTTRTITGTKNHPAYLGWSFTGRTCASYADGMTHGDVFHPYEHIDKAMKFAEDNWGDELILDNWVDVFDIGVQDPTDLVNDRHHQNQPRTKAVLRITLNRKLNEIRNDNAKPKSELIDDAIVEMTLDIMVWHELKGGRTTGSEYNCAHCGAGLLGSYCTGCGHKFGDDGFRSGWYTPLSRKMVAFLREKDHEFKVDPAVAWAKERQDWESLQQTRKAT